MRTDKVKMIAADLAAHFHPAELQQTLFSLRLRFCWDQVPANIASRMEKIKPTLPGLSKNLGLPLLQAALEEATGITNPRCQVGRLF